MKRLLWFLFVMTVACSPESRTFVPQGPPSPRQDPVVMRRALDMVIGAFAYKYRGQPADGSASLIAALNGSPLERDYALMADIADTLEAMRVIPPLELEQQQPPPTARDSVHTPAAVRLLNLIRTESQRSGAMRKTQSRAWADTLLRLEAALVRPDALPPPPPVNRAPVASFEVSCANTTRLCAVNAGASTDDKLVTAYQWSFGDGWTAGGVTASHTYAVGTFTVTLTVRDAEGLSNATTRVVTLTGTAPPPPDTVVPPPPPPPPPPPDSNSIATLAELPRSVPAFTIPTATRVKFVAAPADLQAAFNSAIGGDELRLTGTFTGNFTLPPCAGAGWITVRSNAADSLLPRPGQRITPRYAPFLPRIETPNTEAAVRTNGKSCRWRFLAVEIIGTLESTEYLAYGLIRFGDYGPIQDQLSEVPSDFIIDRSYIHGTTNHNNTRCIVLNSAATVVRDSWISDCHARGSDSQAIEGWTGPGPYLIENNYLEGAGENVMFGGADPSIAGLRPSDITIRRNHFAKPTSWRTSGWSIKNLFELKNANRVLVENNVFENSWPSSQEGMAIVIKSSKDSCQLAVCLDQGTTDLTFRGNIVRAAAVGLNLQAVDGPTNIPVDRVTVTDNLFQQIGAEGRAALLLWTHALTNITMSRNVLLHESSVGTSRGAMLIMDYANGNARRWNITDNVMTSGAYGVFNNGAIGTAALTASISDNSFRFTRNTIIGAPELAPRYPTGNTFLAGMPTLDLSRFTAAVAGVVVSP